MGELEIFIEDLDAPEDFENDSLANDGSEYYLSHNVDSSNYGITSNGGTTNETVCFCGTRTRKGKIKALLCIALSIVCLVVFVYSVITLSQREEREYYGNGNKDDDSYHHENGPQPTAGLVSNSTEKTPKSSISYSNELTTSEHSSYPFLKAHDTKNPYLLGVVLLFGICCCILSVAAIFRISYK